MTRPTRKAFTRSSDLITIINEHRKLLARFNASLNANGRCTASPDVAKLDRQLSRLERKIIMFRCTTAEELRVKLRYLQSLMPGDGYIRTTVKKAMHN